MTPDTPDSLLAIVADIQVAIPLMRVIGPNDRETVLTVWAERLAALANTPQQAGGEDDDTSKLVIVAEIGDYGPVDSLEMATVIFDDRKICECYHNEDAVLIGDALRLLVASEGDEP